jgi:hypothetical protein
MSSSSDMIAAQTDGHSWKCCLGIASIVAVFLIAWFVYKRCMRSRDHHRRHHHHNKKQKENKKPSANQVAAPQPSALPRRASFKSASPDCKVSMPGAIGSCPMEVRDLADAHMSVSGAVFGSDAEIEADKPSYVLPAIPAGGALDAEQTVESESLLYRFESPAASPEMVDAYYNDGALI